jgi:hypothetical protein
MHPLTNHEPHKLYLGAADGSISSQTFTIPDGSRTTLGGFGGLVVALVLRNISGTGTATDADGAVQVETTSESPGSVSDYSSPADLLLPMALIDDGDVISHAISGPPGQMWRVLNSAGQNIQVEYHFIVPN